MSELKRRLKDGKSDQQGYSHPECRKRNKSLKTCHFLRQILPSSVHLSYRKSITLAQINWKQFKQHFQLEAIPPIGTVTSTPEINQILLQSRGLVPKRKQPYSAFQLSVQNNAVTMTNHDKRKQDNRQIGKGSKKTLPARNARKCVCGWADGKYRGVFNWVS